MIWWALLLFFGGVTLVIVEFILPGLISGIIGGLMLVGAGMLLVYAYPEYTLLIIIGETIAAIAGIGLGILFLMKSGVASGLIQKHEQRAEEGYTNLPTDTRLVGAVGKVMTPLRPAGTIVVNKQRVDAVSTGVFIDSGAVVKVIEVHGNRVVVEAASEFETQPELNAG